MLQNAPKHAILFQNSKIQKFSTEGAWPPPRPLPNGKGTPRPALATLPSVPAAFRLTPRPRLEVWLRACQYCGNPVYCICVTLSSLHYVGRRNRSATVRVDNSPAVVAQQLLDTSVGCYRTAVIRRPIPVLRAGTTQSV